MLMAVYSNYINCVIGMQACYREQLPKASHVISNIIFLRVQLSVSLCLSRSVRLPVCLFFLLSVCISHPLSLSVSLFRWCLTSCLSRLQSSDCRVSSSWSSGFVWRSGERHGSIKFNILNDIYISYVWDRSCFDVVFPAARVSVPKWCLQSTLPA